mgnify:FL=1
MTSIIIGGVIFLVVLIVYLNPQILAYFKEVGNIIPRANNTLPLQDSLAIVRYSVPDGSIASYDGERWVTMTTATKFGKETYDTSKLRGNFDYYYFAQEREYSRDVMFDLGGKPIEYVQSDFKKELSESDWYSRSITKFFGNTILEDYGTTPLKVSLVSIAPRSDSDSSADTTWYKNIPLPYDWDPQYITSLYRSDLREGGRGDAYYYLYAFDSKTRKLTAPVGKIIVRAESGKIYFVRDLSGTAYPENDDFSETPGVSAIKQHLLSWEQSIFTKPVKIDSSVGARYYCVELLDGNLVIRLNNSTSESTVCKQ